MISRALSARSCSATVDPIPPEPPASTISFPCNVLAGDKMPLQIPSFSPQRKNHHRRQKCRNRQIKHAVDICLRMLAEISDDVWPDKSSEIPDRIDQTD